MGVVLAKRTHISFCDFSPNHKSFRMRNPLDMYNKAFSMILLQSRVRLSKEEVEVRTECLAAERAREKRLMAWAPHNFRVLPVPSRWLSEVLRLDELP
jgi:hypothetical protein